ncbi:hypothetical protein [Streptomyces showdoensis]|uniref:Uncharacterized protein n=1 Tax=Streptomyces showdoensis TaxID=68268 RepID=A0A2P2GL88_STREW|nr:hypothetical protein [Streptomyces showdoensis]KKZ72272.1 hypothetical protein VO63_18985 [Streptomyces showdoensis]
MQRFEISYAIIPAGVGPDDYEPGDLERRTGVFEFPDPGPEDYYELGGVRQAYGPAFPDIEARIKATLAPGEQPVIRPQEMRRVD